MGPKLPLVHTLIAAPCDVPWESMTGDERTRHCSECKRDVHNLSAMTGAEVMTFLDALGALPEQQELPCLSVFQRPDGTILTADCPVGLSRRRRKAILQSTLSVGAIAIAAVSAFAMLWGRAPAPTREPAALVEPAPPVVPAVMNTATPAFAYPPPPPVLITPRSNAGTVRWTGVPVSDPTVRRTAGKPVRHDRTATRASRDAETKKALVTLQDAMLASDKF